VTAHINRSAEKRFGAVKASIVLLTLATAVIHISLLFPDLMFIINGLGYLILLAAYLLPISFLQGKRSLVRLAFIGYTAITIAAWLVLGDKGMILGMVTKGIEILLIILLLVDRRRM
jgi:hypothetical protein